MWNAFLEWFDRHKLGIIGSLMLHTTALFYFAMLDLRSVPEERERSELRADVAPPITEEEFERLKRIVLEQTRRTMPVEKPPRED